MSVWHARGQAPSSYPSKGNGFLCFNKTRWPVMFELAYIQQPARIYLLERNIHTIDRAVDQHAL
jgi:hypothetical protein